MADKKMNDFPTAADGAFVYAEDANGNQIKISKADLASVVAGLLSLRGIKAYSRNNIGAVLYPQEYQIQQAVGIMIAYDSNNNSKYWIGCFSFKINDHTTLKMMAATVDVVATNNQGTVQFSESLDRFLVIFH